MGRDLIDFGKERIQILKPNEVGPRGINCHEQIGDFLLSKVVIGHLCDHSLKLISRDDPIFG